MNSRRGIERTRFTNLLLHYCKIVLHEVDVKANAVDIACDRLDKRLCFRHGEALFDQAVLEVHDININCNIAGTL